MTEPYFPNPFRTDGFWLKGNLHSHSSNSDGLLNPFQLAYLYKANGYHFLSITDHNKLTETKSVAEKFKDFVLIPGEEVDAGKSETNTSFHLVALGIREEIQSAVCPQRVIAQVVNQDGGALLGHPYWSSLTVNDLLGLTDYLGIEIFNSTCHFLIGKGYSTVHWDDLLTRGKFSLGFAADDVHWHTNPHRPTDAFRGWIMLKAKELTTENIMKSLKDGLFYSTTGPEVLDMEVSNDTIRVKTAAAQAINFMANNSLGERFTAATKPLKEAAYKVRGKETYIRIEVEDGKGGTAWTNPITFR